VLLLIASSSQAALSQEMPTRGPAYAGGPQRTQPNCALVVTARDAARCIGSVRPAAPVPKLDSSRVYNLPELIDLAETASPEGRIAWAQAEQAMEQAGVARAQYLPLLTFVAQGSDLRAIVPFPKPIAPRGYVTVEEPTEQAQLELQYSLLDFGRKPRLEGTKALEIASTLRLGRVHQTIAFNTAAQFYRTQQAAGQLEAAKAILETARTLLQNAQSQYDNGRATLPDVQNAQAGAAEAEYDLSDAQGEVKKAKLALTEIVGVEPTVEIEIVPQNTAPGETFDAPVEELIQSAWKARPDLLAKVENLRRAHEATSATRSAYLPSVGLTGSGGQTSMWPSADYGQLGPANVPTWSAAVQLRWQVFNGARRHEVSSALAEERAAAEEQRAAQDSVTRQVWDSYVDYQTGLEQERAAQSFLASAQTSYDSSLDAFKYGVRSLVDVVQAERQLAQARLEAVRARSHRLQSAVSLGYAIGDPLQGPASSAGVHP
jgi:outer membrane protein